MTEETDDSADVRSIRDGGVSSLRIDLRYWSSFNGQCGGAFKRGIMSRPRGRYCFIWGFVVVLLGVVSVLNVYIGSISRFEGIGSHAEYNGIQNDVTAIKRVLIPRLIHQTWKTTSDLPPDIAEYVSSWQKMNPGHEHKLYGDDDILAMIRVKQPWLQVTHSFRSIVRLCSLSLCLYMFLRLLTTRCGQ